MVGDGFLMDVLKWPVLWFDDVRAGLKAGTLKSLAAPVVAVGVPYYFFGFPQMEVMDLAKWYLSAGVLQVGVSNALADKPRV